ncbi:MAG TPA: threonine synthase [Actinomycetota bacterium]|nr:threonine synthase [Actinomycetota bacterium]
MMGSWKGIIDHYRDRLEIEDDTPVISLGEGNTPMIFSERISERTGLEVFLKYEGMNPTGSFKDRGMTVAITKAAAAGAKAVVCASTGNTSASAAAYSAKAGILCVVLIPAGNVASGKLAQALVHGAKVVEIRGNFDQAFEITRKLEGPYPIVVVNSTNPHRLLGQKTGAFEICDRLERAPDYHIIPVGNAGNITSYWRGYREYHADGITDTLPAMFGFQAAGSAPIVLGHPVDQPKTIATAIRIGHPASWDGALGAAKDSGGEIRAVTDKAILEAYRLIASEGVFAELASSAPVAGLLQLVAEGRVEKGKTAVCILTGHGLKDPSWAISGAPKPIQVDAQIDAVAEALGF